MMNNSQVNSEVLNRMFQHNDYRREIQIRSADDDAEDPDYYIFEGKAVAFEDETVLFEYQGDKYKEIIKKNAFSEADITNVFAKFNHESSVIGIARTKNGTLAIEVRDDGVYVKIKALKALSVSKDLYLAVRSGLIDKMSFAFTIKEEAYNKETKTWTIYKIGKVYDVALVEIPAYDNTFIYARRKGEVEARLKEVEAFSLENKRNKALALLKEKK